MTQGSLFGSKTLSKNGKGAKEMLRDISDMARQAEEDVQYLVENGHDNVEVHHAFKVISQLNRGIIGVRTTLMNLRASHRLGVLEAMEKPTEEAK